MIAFDAETYYDDTYSLKHMGAWAYCFDARFDCYQVAVWGPKGLIYNGHPARFDWESIRGETLVAHNASFDGCVMLRLQKDGIIPQGIGEKWICTADMAVFFQAPRDLKGAYYHLCGGTISKAYRAKVKGKKADQIVKDGNSAENEAAGSDDARAAYEIAEKYLPQWPEAEQRLSTLNREAGWRGVMVDREALDKALETVAQQRLDNLRLMVWAEDAEDTPLSMDKIRAHGRSVGVPVPASLDAKSADAIFWYETYGKDHPWIFAVRDYRRLNTFYKKLKRLSDETDSDGIYHFAKKYFGAGTGRFSGAGGFNMENLPKYTMFGVDMRGLFIARPGFRYYCPDYSQIEARMLQWRVGATSFLDQIRKAGNVYAAYAFDKKQHPNYNLKKENKKLYDRTKAKVLSLGYQMGHKKYHLKAHQDGLTDLTLQEGKADVYEYRNDNPLVVGHWNHHDNWLRISAARGDDFHEIQLRSGRTLKYFKPRVIRETRTKDNGDTYEGASVVAFNALGGHEVYLYGGKLVENEIQGTARDVLRDAWIALHDAGYRVLFSVHDELIIEVPGHLANEETKQDIRRIMATAATWCADCPLDTDPDTDYVDRYCK